MSKKLTFLILSGPTKEYIDPVRFISNNSSGKMGNALAEAALIKGYNVIFISGPTNTFPSNAKLIEITTALEMFKAVKLNFKKSDIIISAAAVSDYRPVKIYKHKIKKSSEKILIEFTQNPDIIKYCGKNKKNQIVAGFALETKNLINNAKIKLKNKNLDLITSNAGDSIGSDNTTAYIINTDSVVIEVKNNNKKIIAEKIINETIRLFNNIKADKKVS
ncbi:MAG: phosphopantothenoylcysteine decarboxylase [Endomicrobium sp.]|jgi:phosphopantothenoylcysteine synthetase/decarboxylase|nr:phosphopantothenoylcysteine decarboxylase [Endomicrobium sp.]